MDKAMFGAGCFWGVEEVFSELPGVIETAVGYAGGFKDAPTYQEVCTGGTGHAEVVYLTFDPKKISYADLLAVFFKLHDPTTLNRQGPDVGTQYRSAIYYYSDVQKETAEQFIEKLTAEKAFPRAIVTEVKAAPEFYPAEDYHQKYFLKHGSCRLH